MHELQPIFQISTAFKGNISALRVFAERVGRMAAEHDRTADALLQAELEQSLEFLGLSLKQATPTQDKNVDSTSNPASEGLETVKRIVRLLAEQGKLRLLITAATTPKQGELLRCAAITALVSFFEALFADLIGAYYRRYPQALPDETHQLTLSDLRKLDSVEAAERLVIAREIDAVLRKSTEDQLRYFENRLKLALEPVRLYEEGLKEVFLRRNIVVHSNSVVNGYYIKGVSPEIVARFNLREGVHLKNSEEYISESLDLFSVAGMALLQLCWRKWEKNEVKLADADLRSQIYEGLVEERWQLVINLVDLAECIGFYDDSSRREACINRAIALKWLSRDPEAESALDKLDWSAAGIVYKCAIALLRGEVDQFYQHLVRALAADELPSRALEEWPLFRKVRMEERFQEILARKGAQAATAELTAAHRPDLPLGCSTAPAPTDQAAEPSVLGEVSGAADGPRAE